LAGFGSLLVFIVNPVSTAAYVQFDTTGGGVLSNSLNRMDRNEHSDLLAEAERALAESEGLLTQIKQAEQYVREMIVALREELKELRDLDSTENGIA